MEEQNATKYIKTVIGTSSGAIIGMLFAMGYKSHEVRTIYQTFLKKHAETEPDFENILNIYYSLGIDDGSALREGLSEAIAAKFGQNDLTFLEFAKKTGVNLMVCACRVRDLAETVFSVDTTPNQSIITAVLASSAIPIIFKPVAISNEMYVDGALSVNCPVKFINPTQLRDTLCFRIAIPSSNNLETNTSTANSPQFSLSALSLPGFTFSLLINSINKLNQMNLHTPFEITFIDFDPLQTSDPDFCTNRFCFDMRTMKFRIHPNEIDELILQGYTKAHHALAPHFHLTMTSSPEQT